MPRQLKTFITNLGSFEMAIAAPSMKAALEAWGLSHNAFQHGFAKQTDDPKIISATLHSPGVVLKRPVGTTGEFTERAQLPKQILGGKPPKIEPRKRKAQPTRKRNAAPDKHRADRKDQAAILSFEQAKERRQHKRAKEEERDTARQQKEQARIGRALAKADETFEKAHEHHKQALASIEKEREKLERRAELEKERWERERDKLRDAREKARE
jgi:hypothetical protein